MYSTCYRCLGTIFAGTPHYCSTGYTSSYMTCINCLQGYYPYPGFVHYCPYTIPAPIDLRKDCMKDEKKAKKELNEAKRTMISQKVKKIGKQIEQLEQERTKMIEEYFKIQFD